MLRGQERHPDARPGCGSASCRRSSASATPRRSKSPIVGAEKPPAPPAPAAIDPNADCDGDGQANKVDTDDDNDLLADTLENVAHKLDQCKADTDGDGVEDGYEYQSARDLNDDEHREPEHLPAVPGEAPVPEPARRHGRATDHDGDTLTLMEEYDLWKYTIAQGAARTLSR